MAAAEPDEIRLTFLNESAHNLQIWAWVPSAIPQTMDAEGGIRAEMRPEQVMARSCSVGMNGVVPTAGAHVDTQHPPVVNLATVGRVRTFAPEHQTLRERRNGLRLNPGETDSTSLPANRGLPHVTVTLNLNGVDHDKWTDNGTSNRFFIIRDANNPPMPITIACFSAQPAPPTLPPAPASLARVRALERLVAQHGVDEFVTQQLGIDNVNVAKACRSHWPRLMTELNNKDCAVVVCTTRDCIIKHVLDAGNNDTYFAEALDPSTNMQWKRVKSSDLAYGMHVVQRQRDNPAAPAGMLLRANISSRVSKNSDAADFNFTIRRNQEVANACLPRRAGIETHRCLLLLVHSGAFWCDSWHVFLDEHDRPSTIKSQFRTPWSNWSGPWTE